MEQPIIEIVHERSCSFKKKPGTKHVCVNCGEHRLLPAHGCFSYQGNGRMIDHPRVYQAANVAWRSMWLSRLGLAGMPTGCSRIEVQGLICFPDHKNRDEGNHRFLIEKFLGDALQDGGYLINDDWSSYRFRELDLALPEPGRQWVRLVLSVS